PWPAAKQQVCDVATALGRVSPEPAQGISLQSLLRVVPPMAPEARRGSTPGAPCWREDVCRLGRCHHSDLRSRNGGGPTGLAVRSCTRRQFLRLCASHTPPGPFQLDRVSRPGL